MVKLFIVLLIFPLFALSQFICKDGKYNTTLFTISDFKSSSQIWTGNQGFNNKVYFGNDNSILEFNGNTWNKIKSENPDFSSKEIEKINKTKVYNIFTASDQKTYVGRENNIGVLEYNKIGTTIYKPFKYLL